MANRIKELREKSGLTQDQVAEVAGTTFQQIARLETGKRRLTDDWMRRIAPALDVSPAALLTDEAPDAVKVVQQPKKLRLFPDEVRLIRFWRTLDIREKRMIAAYARDRGLEILSDDPERKRA
jgi:transcriptional regulator with XRE-family HTH domain